MLLPDLPPSAVRVVGGLLTQGSVLRLALTGSGCWASLHHGKHWRFETLKIDGDYHNSAGVFAVVTTDELISLTVEHFGLRLFKALAAWPFSRVESLEVGECLFECGGAAALAELASRCPLRRLVLRRCFVKAADLEVLAAGLGASKLRCLSVLESGLTVSIGPALDNWVSGSYIQDLTLSGRIKFTAELAGTLGRHSHLQRLRILGNPLLDDMAVCALCDSLQSRASSACLTHVSLTATGGGSLTDKSGRALGAVLFAGLGLKDISLHGHRMTKASLAACLAGGATLREVDFTANDLGGDFVEGELMAAVPCASRLRTLRVGGGSGRWLEHDDSDVEGQDQARRPLATLAWSAGALTCLRALDVSGANLNDDAVVAFSAAMVTCDAIRLHELDLSRNYITEEGIVALMVGLRHGGARLKRLHLANNEAGDEGCEAVGAAMQPGGPLEELWDLSLRANQVAVTKALRAGFRQGLPLQILDLRENLLGDDELQRVVDAWRRAGGGPPVPYDSSGDDGADGPATRFGIHLAGNECSEELAAELGILPVDDDVDGGEANVGGGRGMACISIDDVFRDSERTSGMACISIDDVFRDSERTSGIDRDRQAADSGASIANTLIADSGEARALLSGYGLGLPAATAAATPADARFASSAPGLNTDVVGVAGSAATALGGRSSAPVPDVNARLQQAAGATPSSGGHVSARADFGASDPDDGWGGQDEPVSLPAGAPTHGEWQECLDVMAWAEGQLKNIEK